MDKPTKQDVEQLRADVKQLQDDRDRLLSRMHPISTMPIEGETPEGIRESAAAAATAYDLPDTRWWAKDHNTRTTAQVISELDGLLKKL